MQRADAVAQRGQVARGVAVALVALLHDERERLAVAIVEARREDALRAVTLDQKAERVEVGHDVVEQVVVVRLADHVRRAERDVELRVDLVEVLHRLVHQDSPQPARLVVA